MDAIGAEVGQKMRSAIKAKLLELNCYVDDELPDYIMVMVANKRSKSQMNEDLNLFLSTKTSTFVDWLHIVLKKLKEVTVTNPEVYKKVSKRKLLNEQPDVKVKKEKRESKSKRASTSSDGEQSKSLTDNLPVNYLSGHRKITVLKETKVDNSFEDGFDIPLLSEVNMSSEKDLEEIEKKIKSVKSRLGLLVESDIEEELPEIKSEKEYRTQAINSRTVLLEEEKLNANEILDSDQAKPQENAKDTESNGDNNVKRHEHKRITFSPEKEEVSTRKMSVLDRLGKRDEPNPIRTRISLSEFRKEEEPFLHYARDKERTRQSERDWRHRKDRRSEREKRDRENRRGLSRERRRDGSRERRRDRSCESRTNIYKEGILSRLGVMSKISMPPREPEEPEPEDELKTREVRSMVQVKPRVIPSGAPQPNTNLLLKAVAEAQKSIAQTPKVGSHSTGESTSGRYEEGERERRASDEGHSYRKFSQSEKTKLKNLILAQAAQRNRYSGDDERKPEEEYIPKPIRNTPKEPPNYVPSLRHMDDDEDTEQNGKIKRQFHATVGILEKSKPEGVSKPSIKSRLDHGVIRPSIKSRLDGRKSPSPIIFDRVGTKINGKSNIPDKLPIVHPPLSIKNKERCKYWPGCRQGDKCEFVHPSINCEAFPHCKWGDRCLYLHPNCKFGSSCTKRDCLYSHLTSKLSTSRLASSGKLSSSGLQTCKYYPNCTNISCTFFHPKPCKFGKYCKNQSDCSFSHIFASSKSSLTWRSK